MKLLEGKKAFITGARKGIGRGFAVRMAEEGADIGLNDVIDDAATRKTASMVEAAGRQATLHIGDVSTAPGISRVIDEFVVKHGRIDILVNNAIFPDQRRPLFETDEAYWDRMMDLSLKAYFFGAQAAARHMVRQGQGGRILFLSSIMSYKAWPEWTAYGIAKAGLRRMAQGIAVDLAGTGITVNAIAPGAINNTLTEQGIDPPPRDFSGSRVMDHVPSRRDGMPSDIANAAVFLCSKMGEFVNGETLSVDGGWKGSGVALR